MIRNTTTPTDCHGRSDVGRKRETNEDRFLIADLKRQMLICESNLDDSAGYELAADIPGKLMIVADGLGGHVGGERASALAVQTACDYVLNSMHRFLKLADERDEEFRDELAAAVERCQRRIALERQANPELAGMATTLIMAYIVWPRMYLVHVGDSRCYLMRGGVLRQLTTDHTIAQQFIDSGALTEEAAEHSPWNHVLWNCLGGHDQKIAPDVLRFDLRAHDVVLMCTDGLSKRLSLLEIQQILEGDLLAEDLTEQLIDIANARGGDDNITVVLAKFAGPPQPTDACGESCGQTTSASIRDTLPGGLDPLVSDDPAIQR